MIEYADLDAKRPGTGLEPKEIESIVGRKAKQDIAYDQLISIEDLVC